MVELGRLKLPTEVILRLHPQFSSKSQWRHFPSRQLRLYRCIPITDDGIKEVKEVYWLAVLVHSQGQQHLPIQIFPARLTSDGFNSLAATYSNQPNLVAFWRNLKEGYDLFEKSRQLPGIKTAPPTARTNSPRVPPAFSPTLMRKLKR